MLPIERQLMLGAGRPKEACFKALSRGFERNVGDAYQTLSRIGWQDIVIYNTATGRPGIDLKQSALHCLQAMTPQAHQTRIHLSLSDDPPFAQAYVLIEALPETGQ